MKVFLALFAGALVIIAAVSLTRSPTPEATAQPVSRQTRLLDHVQALQAKLHRVAGDFTGWADLGGSYVELARVTADPTYYTKAQGALEKSLALQADGNGPAMVGMGALANARHDFGKAKEWALKAEAVQPGTAEVYGVLADALTQLGDDKGAADAVQRMLDLKPNVAAFTRASYHFELHGQENEARSALERALSSATSADETAYCRYYLGELAFNAGKLDEAADQYEQGITASPNDPALQQGKAKVAAARGHTDEALDIYREVVARAPLPQYFVEYAELLTKAGNPDEAAKQLAIVAQQQKLLESQGATDDLSASLIAADHGDKAEALRRAEAEWGRRQSVFVADAMAWALHVNGRDAEALVYADKAVANGWRNPVVVGHRNAIMAGAR
ncbi:tetratricopeptide repeat protein [Actinocrispum sp. NPDC049592]|uniref:tetratricopeptide repeat protein n=1 Tax=Actinocrispum sp. NPDC049592 TaxID=3154835 RepID=UPI003413A0C7